LKFQTTLYQLAATLRSAAPEELSWLVLQVQSLPTDQDAVNYLVQMLGKTMWINYYKDKEMSEVLSIEWPR
jgi:hypothetical protein